MDSVIPLCRLDDIPDGASRGFDPHGAGRDTLFIVRHGAALHGWRDQCPHEGETPMPLVRHRYLNAAGTRIVCFAHGAQFEIETGMCILGPCRGEALSPVALRVSASGEVFLEAGSSCPPSGGTPPAAQDDFSEGGK